MPPRDLKKFVQERFMAKLGYMIFMASIYDVQVMLGCPGCFVERRNSNRRDIVSVSVPADWDLSVDARGLNCIKNIFVCQATRLEDRLWDVKAIMGQPDNPNTIWLKGGFIYELAEYRAFGHTPQEAKDRAAEPYIKAILGR